MGTVYRTRAFELAKALGWSSRDLDERLISAGLSTHMIDSLRQKRRGCGPVAIAAIQKAFPDKTFSDLFYLEDPDQQPGAEGPKVEGVA